MFVRIILVIVFGFTSTQRRHEVQSQALRKTQHVVRTVRRCLGELHERICDQIWQIRGEREASLVA